MSNEQFVKQADIYERVTRQIIEAIEAGCRAYRMPWHITDAEAFSPVNAVSKRPYRGVNVLSLWIAAERRGYASGLWATYKQWEELGAQVRRGEKSTLIVFWKVSEREDESEQASEGDEPERGRVFLAKGYPVFNVAQVEGYTPPEVPELSESERIQSRRSGSLPRSGQTSGTAEIEAFYEPERGFHPAATLRGLPGGRRVLFDPGPRVDPLDRGRRVG